MKVIFKFEFNRSGLSYEFMTLLRDVSVQIQAKVQHCNLEACLLLMNFYIQSKFIVELSAFAVRSDAQGNTLARCIHTQFLNMERAGSGWARGANDDDKDNKTTRKMEPVAYSWIQ